VGKARILVVDDEPEIVILARVSEEDMKRSKECHADAHINKPFGREKLLSTVENFQRV
jgi:CheY-like chemotaxis protein